MLLFRRKTHAAAFSIMCPSVDLPSEMWRYRRLHHPFNPWPLCWGSWCTWMGIFSEMNTYWRGQNDNKEVSSFNNNFKRFLVWVEWKLMNSEVQDAQPFIFCMLKNRRKIEVFMSFSTIQWDLFGTGRRGVCYVYSLIIWIQLKCLRNDGCEVWTLLWGRLRREAIVWILNSMHRIRETSLHLQGLVLLLHLSQKELAACISVLLTDAGSKYVLCLTWFALYCWSARKNIYRNINNIKKAWSFSC